MKPNLYTLFGRQTCHCKSSLICGEYEKFWVLSHNLHQIIAIKSPFLLPFKSHDSLSWSIGLANTVRRSQCFVILLQCRLKSFEFFFKQPCSKVTFSCYHFSLPSLMFLSFFRMFIIPFELTGYFQQSLIMFI